MINKIVFTISSSRIKLHALKIYFNNFKTQEKNTFLMPWKHQSVTVNGLFKSLKVTQYH